MKSKSYEKIQNVHCPVGAYAVQCGKCFKWRFIPTVEEYETIRHTFIEDPWFCDKKPDVSCDDPGDLEYDTSRMWIIDKPNIPKAPPGFERGLTMKRGSARIDSYYTTPTGKKVRAPAEVDKYLEANPKYKGVSVSQFNFAVPKILEDMLPRNGKGKGQGSSSGKKIKMSKAEDD